ncbi:MAG: EamA family transporter [Geminicoccaceae bacterium]
MNPHYLALFAAISISATGQLLLKAGAVAAEGGFLAQLFRPQTILGLGCYGCSAMLYIVALRAIPMSVALPSTALSYVVIAFLGFLVWNEPMSWNHLLALLLICSGVLLLTRA